MKLEMAEEEIVKAASPLSRDLFQTFGTRILLMLSVAITGPISARLLGSEGRGNLAAVQNWGALLGLFATLGLSEAVLYYSAKKKNESGQHLTTAAVMSLMVCIPIVAIAYWLMPVLLRSQGSDIVAEARIYLLFVPINVLTLIIYGALRGNQLIGRWNILRLAASGAWLMILASAWIIGLNDVSFITRSFLAATLCLLLITLWVAWRNVPGPFRFRKHLRKPLIQYGLPSIFGTLPGNLTLRMDQLLMAALLSPILLGYYVVAVSWTGVLQSFGGSAAVVLLPRVSEMTDLAQQHNLASKFIRLTILTSLVTGLAFVVITPVAIPLLFGEDFAAAVPAALVLTPATLLWGVKLVLADLLRAIGQPKWVMAAEVAGLGLTGLLLWILLKPFGILGAAFASLVSYALIVVLLYFAISHHLGISLPEIIPGRSDVNFLLRRSAEAMRGVLLRLRGRGFHPAVNGK